MNAAPSYPPADIVSASRFPLPAPTLAIVKVCGCCGLHHTERDWTSLEFVGFQDDGDGGLLALRNCVCRSTIAVDLNEWAARRLGGAL